MKPSLRLLAVASIIALGISSCKKDNMEEENDNEVITTVEVRLTEQGTSTEQVYKWEDLEGDGSPIIQDIVLAPGKVYNVSLKLYDKTKTPVENTTEDIEEEAVDHRFYFQPSVGSNITVSNLDNDDNGVPVGLTSVWTTGAVATGTINIVLRHYENGGKELSDDVNSSKSSTDVDVTFTTKVQ